MTDYSKLSVEDAEFVREMREVFLNGDETGFYITDLNLIYLIKIIKSYYMKTKRAGGIGILTRPMTFLMSFFRTGMCF